MAVVRTWYKFLRGPLWLNGTFRILLGTPEAYLVSAIFVALASLIRWSLGFVGTPLLPFTAFYPAVLFATYVGGLGAGTFAALLGGLVGWAAFMPPHPLAPGRALDLPLYALACGFLIWGAESYRRPGSPPQKQEGLCKVAGGKLVPRLQKQNAPL